MMLLTGKMQLNAQTPDYKNKNLSIDERVADLVSKMTLEEKCQQVVGKSIDYNQEALASCERLGIPPFVIVHGPFGGKFKRTAQMQIGTYFPVSIAMAATWNEKMVTEITTAMGAEMNAWGGLANAGPAMNIIRDPRTGRSFEYFTEDPFLNGRITAAYTRGLQSEKVAVILKHYICNNQELNRHGLDIHVSERAMREIYMPGFKDAVVNADAKVIMGAYNMVNGVYSCENDFILNKVLRDDWGFDGFVLSDWSGTHSTVDAATNGLDVEMPRERYYGKKLVEAVKRGDVSEETINTMVSNVLRVMFWTGVFDQGPSHETSILRSPEHLAIARKASAQSMVLLKNEYSILPIDLKKNKKIAVIGPNGNYGKHFRNGKYHVGLLQGGGSSSIGTKQSSMVTPFQGIKNNVGKGIDVAYAPGCYAESGCGNIPTKYLRTADGKEGMLATYFGNDKFEGKSLKKEVTKELSYLWQGELDIPEAGLNMDDKNRFSIEFKSILTVPETRNYTFEVRNESGFAQLFIDGKLLAENKNGSRVYWNDMGDIDLDEGKEYELVVKFAKTGPKADLSIGWDYENVQYLEEAKELAENSDAVILTVGLSGQMGETEAGDRRRMELFPAQENLINEIAKVNKNCAVVVVAGSAVTMDNWLENIPALLYAWYPGEQGGNALADILFGNENPAGRLPITFAKSSDQYPADFYSLTDDIEYKEGIYVGYRYFDKYNKKVLFPFGYGLSYTSFRYSNLDISVSEKEGKTVVNVKADIENTGKRDGDEVIQLYVHDKEASVDRPEKELKGFKRISLKSGEKKTIEFTLGDDAFAFWNDTRKKWQVEPGKFEIRVGKSSTDIQLEGFIELNN
ncbi:glycoside hydrolase family 3 C-terminal domain-containing protein [uncultured Draconibacterium sp.]|uniref:beta-glucosidase n=1 Tax=uncultured Draconibacterium sp. TaxID=1573823 RepID=UPI0029C7B444|nr:glycoside hydrolase family 3 C-terminal domain-containing protein [uncultured Draconibacterium sp.]